MGQIEAPEMVQGRVLSKVSLFKFKLIGKFAHKEMYKQSPPFSNFLPSLLHSTSFPFLFSVLYVHRPKIDPIHGFIPPVATLRDGGDGLSPLYFLKWFFLIFSLIFLTLHGFEKKQNGVKIYSTVYKK